MGRGCYIELICFLFIIILLSSSVIIILFWCCVVVWGSYINLKNVLDLVSLRSNEPRNDYLQKSMNFKGCWLKKRLNVRIMPVHRFNRHKNLRRFTTIWNSQDLIMHRESFTEEKTHKISLFAHLCAPRDNYLGYRDRVSIQRFSTGCNCFTCLEQGLKRANS